MHTRATLLNVIFRVTTIAVSSLLACIACDDDTSRSLPQLSGELAGSIAGSDAGSGAGSDAGVGAGSDAGAGAGEVAGGSDPETFESGDVDLVWTHTTECILTLKYQDSTAQQVQLAGSFTNWAQAPIEMQRRGDIFTLDLEEGDFGLTSSDRYPYKLIVDGEWILDPDNHLQAFDGDCLNSAFKLPDCGQPSLSFTSLEASWNQGAGQIKGVAALRVIQGDERLTRIEVKIGDQLIPFAVNWSEGTIEFTLTGLRQGKYWISLTIDTETRDDPITHSAALWVEERPFSWTTTPMYMLLVDRFANGDPQNDQAVGSPVGYSADWHGGDLQGALRALEAGYFDELGVKAIWLSPINQQVEGHFPDRVGAGRRFSAYHGYWPISGRSVDPRYGGDEGLRDFVQAAHERGIRVLLDLINNQIHEEHEYYLSHPEWFRTSCVCGLEAGCGWSERPLDCLFASYLPDINWRVEAAEEQFIADALYWVDEFDIDGFRVDAVKHVETTSIYNLRDALFKRFEGDGQGTRIWMFGETAVGEADQLNDGCGITYEDGYQWIDAYTGVRALDGQFDFPTHHRVRWQLLSGEGNFWEIDAAIADSLSRYHPRGLHVRFLGSHDSSRVASEASRDQAIRCRFEDEGCGGLSSISSDPLIYQRLRRAWLLLWSSPGIPLLYYGDEVGMAGGNDPDSRRDMMWGEDLSELQMSAPDREAPVLSDQQLALRSWFTQLADLSQRSPSFSGGQWQTLWVDPNFYVFAKYTTLPSGAREVSLIALNQQNATIEVTPPLTPDLRWLLSFEGTSSPLLGTGTALFLTDEQAVHLSLPPGAASVWQWREEELNE